MSNQTTTVARKDYPAIKRQRELFIDHYLQQLPDPLLRTICSNIASTPHFRFEGDKLIVNVEELRSWPTQNEKSKQAAQWAIGLKLVHTLELVTLTVADCVSFQTGRYHVVHALSIAQLRPWFKLVGGTETKLQISNQGKQAYESRIPRKF